MAVYRMEIIWTSVTQLRQKDQMSVRLIYFKQERGYSSVVEHSTADREVPGSNPGVPLVFSFLC